MKSSRRTHDVFISWCVCDSVFMTICNDCACEMVFVWSDESMSVKWYIFDLMWWVWDGAWTRVMSSSSSSSCLLSTARKQRQNKTNQVYIYMYMNIYMYIYIYMYVYIYIYSNTHSDKTKPIKCESFYVDLVINPQKFLRMYMNICV